MAAACLPLQLYDNYTIIIINWQCIVLVAVGAQACFGLNRAPNWTAYTSRYTGASLCSDHHQ